MLGGFPAQGCNVRGNQFRGWRFAETYVTVKGMFHAGSKNSRPPLQRCISSMIPIDKKTTDSVTVGTVNATGNTVDVPVYIRDISGNALGRDQAAGSKIQSFSIKVSYSPAASVSSVTFTRAGITASLAPSASFNPAATGSISLVDTFQESSNLIPLTLNAAAPGDLVAHLVFTLSGRTDLGSAIAIRLDPSRTLLSDEGGNRSESAANGKLVLVDGGINVPSQMMTTPHASMASTPAETGSTS